MRLVSCYIENFGGLSRFTMDFEPGLTVLQQPNGFGKTTLAEFIRAMFYGFPRKTRNQLGRRQKYCPWNGGKYGGNLTFEHEGRQYRVERTFGTTPRGDSFNLIDLQTGRKSSRFPEEVGQALFGLDADSFERSTYLPQSREMGPLTTDSIRAKLSDLVEDTGDVGNFEKAVQTLRTKRSSYVPYRGQGGAVAEDQARITRLQQALDGARESEQALTRSAGELQQLQAEQVRVTGEIDSLRRDLTAANEAAARLAHHQHHDRLTAALAQAEAEQNALAGKYPRGMPRQEELDPVSDAVDQAARLAALPVTAEDQKAQRFVEAHGSRFAEGVPDGAEFDRLRRTWDDRWKAEARLDACTLPEGENAELRGLESFFAPGIPEEEALNRCEKDLEEAARLRRENLRLAAQTVETVPCKVPSPLTGPLLLGSGGAALLTGIVLLVRGHHAPGGVALALGVLALLCAAWVNLRRTMTRQVTALSPQLQALILENEEQAAALEAAARSFGKIYGNAEPAEIRRRVRRLEDLQARQQAMAGSRWELNALVAEYDAALDGFFEKYHYRPEGDAYDGLNRFQRICETWGRAQQQLRDRDERLEQHRLETAQIQAVLDAFREKYGAVPRNRAQVLTLRDDIRRSGELADTAEKLRQQLVAYRREHGEALAAPVPAETADPAALRRREAALLERHSRISGELLRLEQQVRQLRESADRIPELQDELSRWQEKKKEDQSSAAVLDDTLGFLSKARENLSTAYMGSIRQSFAGLMTRMAGEQAEKILVTPELEVHLEREGQSRPLAYFSAGQTDLTMLCMRLALVDALFREARPFVILDDPFVNLDDTHTREALALLQELSRDRQIIYLTCHSSRR